MGKMRFAQVPERVLTQSFVVLIIGNSKSNHLEGAQGTSKRVSVGDALRSSSVSWLALVFAFSVFKEQG